MVRNNRRTVKLKAVKYKGGKCEICGYNKCLPALTFHHRDMSKKEYALSTMLKNKSWGDIKVELDKCHLLCSNCHYEVHDGLIDGYLE